MRSGPAQLPRGFHRYTSLSAPRGRAFPPFPLFPTPEQAGFGREDAPSPGGSAAAAIQSPRASDAGAMEKWVRHIGHHVLLLSFHTPYRRADGK